MVAAGQSNMKRLLLECGGKAPNIVFDDCPNLEAVAEGIVARAFWNQGQVCTASSRLLVQGSIKGELLEILVQKAATLRPGDPLRPETTFGALVSRGHMDRVLSTTSPAASRTGQESFANPIRRHLLRAASMYRLSFSIASPPSRG